MRLLDKLTSEAMAQSINEPDIVENSSKGFRANLAKLGSAVVFGILTLGVTGMSTEAQAMDGKTVAIVTGVAGLAGMASNGSLPNNLPPECSNIQGVSGWQDAGSAGIGAALLGQGGGGRGKTGLTVLGGILGYAVSSGTQQQRIKKQCDEIIARLQQQEQQKQQYSNPQHNQNASTPTPDILYQANTPSGQVFFVTIENSPGMLAITGNRHGIIDPITSPVVFNGVKQSLDNLNIAYTNLNSVSKRYLKAVNGTEEEIFNPNPENNSNYRNPTQIGQLKTEYDKSYNNYATKRGVAAHILDEASARNYNLNEFSNYAQLFQVPQSAKVTYSSVYKKPFENRFANDIKVGNGIR